MPSPKKSCPTCPGKMQATSTQCRRCNPAYVRTAQHKKRMSAAVSGLAKPWAKQNRNCESAVKKIAAYWTPARRKAAKLRGLKLAKSKEWRLKCGRPGELNSRWEHGRSKLKYARGWTRKVKRLAWKRAKNKCELCGKKPRDTHHIDFEKDNHDLDNLQVLCRKCHVGLHVAHKKATQRKRVATRGN